MPRYFFDTGYGPLLRDEDGVVLVDIEAAWEQATQTTGHILRDLDGNFERDREWRMEVSDGEGRRLFTLHISTTVHGDWAPAVRG
ncbi:DUF6894 family protein [Mesorhizobium sp. ArgA1]